MHSLREVNLGNMLIEALAMDRGQFQFRLCRHTGAITTLGIRISSASVHPLYPTNSITFRLTAKVPAPQGLPPLTSSIFVKIANAVA